MNVQLQIPQRTVPRVKVNTMASLTIFLWASAFPFSKIAMEYFSPNALGCLRITCAAIFLLLLGAIQHIRLPARKDIGFFFLSGALGFTLYMLTFNMGLRTLSSSTSSLIMAMTPILTAVGALLLYKERISLIGWLAIAIEFAGILVLTLWGGVLSINVGILWTLCTAVFFCGYNLCQRKLLSLDYTPLEVTVYSITAGALLFLPLLPGSLKQLQTAPEASILVTIYLGVFPNAIAAFTWGKALLWTDKTSNVTNFMFVTPLLASVLGFLLLGEFPSLETLLGGALILGGLILFQRNHAA